MKANAKSVARPKYKAMVKHAQFIIKQYAEHPGPFGVTAEQVFAMASVDVAGRRERVSPHEAQVAWPSIVRELRLVKDEFGCWTLPGREITAKHAQQSVAELEQMLDGKAR